MNKLITNQTVYYSLKQESITDFPSQELTTELNLKQTDWVRQQLINKVAVKASYMHKSQLTDDIIEEIMETHKIIGVEPHQKYLIVEIENTTNDKTFPVKVELSKSDIDSNDGPTYVDLGLPSGTLWATMNVGATSETDYGNYYMYGMGIKTYDSTDTPYAGTENPLAMSVDTAAQVWGGDWHMPTKTQMEELTANTTYQWVTDYNGSGINGGLFTAQNGNSIFLPAAGHWYDGSQNDVGDDGSYWGSSPDGSDYACYLDFYDGGKDVGIYGRRLGYSVRPVVG